MKLVLVLAAVILTGCGAPRPFVNSSGSIVPQQIAMECRYEAAKATAGIRDGFTAGFQEGQLTRQCLAIRGYTN